MIRRLRRYRTKEGIRKLVSETSFSVSDLMYPIFVWDGQTQEISPMPGQFRWNVKDKELYNFMEKLIKRGLTSILVFGVALEKDEIGSEGWNEQGVVQRFTRNLKKDFPELIIATDVCLCPWRQDGQCGVFRNGQVLNDESLEYLSRIALSHARAGADIVAPSDMMDGRVKRIRETLDAEGFHNTLIMSYSAKYASSLYGPFRVAANSAPKIGDRTTYQLNPSQLREAVMEASTDIEEGTDIIMVKPALFYLDVIRELRNRFLLPVAAFSVSGEYSMIKLGIKEGLFDERKILYELLVALKRAGSDIIISYFVPDILLKWETLF